MKKKMLALVGAGVATGAFLNTEKGKEFKNNVKAKAKELVEAAEEKYEEVKEDVKERVKKASTTIRKKVKEAAINALEKEEKVHNVVRTVLEKASQINDANEIEEELEVEAGLVRRNSKARLAKAEVTTRAIKRMQAKRKSGGRSNGGSTRKPTRSSAR